MNWSKLARVLGIEENEKKLKSNEVDEEAQAVEVKDKDRDATVKIKESVVNVNNFSIKRIIFIALGLIIFYLAIKNIAVGNKLHRDIYLVFHTIYTGSSPSICHKCADDQD